MGGRMSVATEDRIAGAAAGRGVGVLRPGSRGMCEMSHARQVAWHVTPAGECAVQCAACAGAVRLGSAGTPDRGDGKGCGARCEAAG